MFVKKEECRVTPCEPGFTRKVMAYNEEVMMCEVSFEAGSVGNTHSHPHVQVTYVAEGSFAFTIGDETRIVNKGDSVLMPGGAAHGVKCLEAGKLVDVFVPMRQEFVQEV